MTKQKQSPYDLFGTSHDLESGAGVTLDYPGFSITIHRAGGSNKKYGQVLQKNMKPHQQKFDRGLLDNETSEKILLQSFAEGVVIGWDGVTDKSGKKMPFSVDNCIKLFTDLPDLYADVKAAANNASLFREETEKVEEKN